jgi:hypothetical protein
MEQVVQQELLILAEVVVQVGHRTYHQQLTQQQQVVQV